MVHFNVPDMTCGGCAQRIRRAIDDAELPEGMEVTIDVAARQIRVPTHAQVREIDLVLSAIERAGYKTEADSASPSGRASGNCCCAPRPSTKVDADQYDAVRTSPCCS
ncbi:heavy-metal-associated domain-containing protein [Acidovorax facilis]|uniref:heavy-metal-associated domain-containing protein n=1 Tax=Acidovorax facilis TaxID=12917 RepID=UPI003CEDBECE